MKSLSVFLTAALCAGAPASHAFAGIIIWGDSFVIDDATDIKSPAAGTLILAGDFNSTTGFAAGEDDMINGLLFTRVDQNVPDMLTTNIASGPSYNATYVGTDTDDLDLDALLDAHAYLPGNPGLATITLESLTPGTNYQVQLIGVADDRGCCAGRIYEPDDGAGNFTTGKTMQRGLHQSLIGTFAATSATQTIQIRSLDGAAGNNDPGLSGLVVFQTGAAGDMDGDGLFDVWETQYGFDPTKKDSNGNTTPDGQEDGDADGLNNLAEQLKDLDPTKPDTDADGLKDGVETNTGVWAGATNTGTNPKKADTDGDTLLDGVENPDLPFTGPTQTGSNPLLADTDGDAFSDALEVGQNSDPGDPDKTPGGIKLTYLGTGTDALLDGDLTDPENDIDDSTPEGMNFNWISSSASSENYFGTEGALDLFDNQVAAGVAKWCCGAAPQNVTLEFAAPVSLTHFTISSGNDVPERDPIDWGILGSNDGVDFTPILAWSDPGTLSLWRERLQVLRIDLPAPSPFYKFLRYDVTRTGGTQHQLGEIEFFGTTQAVASDFRIIDVARNATTNAITLTWTSSPGKLYSVFYSETLASFVDKAQGDIPSGGATTSVTFPNPLPNAALRFFRVQQQP